jgi:hypothetical protein
MVVKIPKKLEMKSLLPAPRSPLPAHVLAFPVGSLHGNAVASFPIQLLGAFLAMKELAEAAVGHVLVDEVMGLRVLVRRIWICK